MSFWWLLLQDHTEELQILKEDYAKMKTHLNVSAKLELQTQERMYESRLHHLENVLEEMRQREGHFLQLAEETAVLKDQVDSLRELSVMVLKDEPGNSNRLPPSAMMESPVRSQSNFSFKSDDNTLDKEIRENAIAMQTEQEQHQQSQQPCRMFGDSNDTLNSEGTEKDNNQDTMMEQLNLVKMPSPEKEEASLPEATTNDVTDSVHVKQPTKGGIKVSGTLKLTKPVQFSKSNTDLLKLDDRDVGCFPKWLAAIWTSCFD